MVTGKRVQGKLMTAKAMILDFKFIIPERNCVLFKLTFPFWQCRSLDWLLAQLVSKEREGKLSNEDDRSNVVGPKGSLFEKPP